MTGRARRRPKAVGPADVPLRRRRPIAFGIHQLLEYLLAAGLVVLSVHVGRSRLFLVSGVMFGVLALSARGPLGILRLCGRRLHATLDVGAAVLLAVAPLVPPLRPGPVGIVAVEFVALAWLRVAMLTRYSGDRDASAITDRNGRTSHPGGPSGADATAAPPGQVLSAIRGLGRMTAAATSRLPDAQSALDTGARRVGTEAGRLRRAWRRAAR